MSHQINVGSIHHDLATYQQAAMETKVDTTQEQFLYMFGIWGELHEIDLAWGMGQFSDLIDELGDLLWYTALACQISRISLQDYAPEQRPLATDAPVLRDVGMRDLWVPASRLAEALKKYYWHRRAAPDIGVPIRQILIAIQRIALQVCQVDLGAVAERNISNLQRRYPNGFRSALPGPAPILRVINTETGKSCQATDGADLYQVIDGVFAGIQGSQAALTAQCGAVRHGLPILAIDAATQSLVRYADMAWHSTTDDPICSPARLAHALAGIQTYGQQTLDDLAILAYGDHPLAARLRPQIQALHHQIHELVPPLVQACQEELS